VTPTIPTPPPASIPTISIPTSSLPTPAPVLGPSAFPTGTTYTRLPSPPPATSGPLSSLRVQGPIQSINAGAGQVVIAPPGRAPVALLVGSSTTIQKNGRPASLAALSAGDGALAVYRTDGSLAFASSITAQSVGKQISGFLEQVDSQRRVSVRTADGMPFLLQVGPQSQIMLNGNQIPFARLEPGHSAVVTYQLPEGRGLPVIIRLDVF
jgi:hypothetical protein